MAPPLQKLVITIDIGATTTKVIYSLHSHEKSWPVKISDWPGSPGGRFGFHKISLVSQYIPSPTDVPTLLAYGPNHGDVCWGFQVSEAPAEWTRVQGFYNLDLLDPGSTIASQATPSPLNKSFHDLCRDFIDCLYTDLVYILSNNSFPPSEIAYHVFFTMPKSTSKPSINTIRSIIQETGFGKHSFYVGRTDWDAVAANVYVNTISKEPERFYKFAEPGKHFLICDAGGLLLLISCEAQKLLRTKHFGPGKTIRIHSYVITHVIDVPGYELQVAVESTDQHMGLVNHGSSEIDEAFIRYVQNIPAANIPPSGPFSQKAMDNIMGQFLHLKERNRTRSIFASEYPSLPESALLVFPKEYHHLQVGNSGLTGSMTIEKNHWETFFQNPVRSIIELLRKYIYYCLDSGIRITDVFLVGGFGRSFYLRETVRQNLPGVYVYASGASDTTYAYGPHDTHVTLCSLADISVPETIKVSSGVYDELLEQKRLHAKVNGHITNVISYGCNTEGSRRQTFRRETWKSISQLGSGGAGTVWLEENTAQVGRFRAVKVVSKSLPVDYKRELVAAAVLSKFEAFFLNFLGWYENEQSLFIAMEYIALGDLGKYMSTVRTRDESTTRSIMRQVIEALEVMNRHGFVHRDLKPQNIFVVSRSPLWVKIGDFGISKRLNEETQIRTAIYTPRYAAPEICGCSPYNAYLDSNSAHSMAVDIWSVGIITHELLTKEIPFANSMQIVHYTEGRIGFPTRALDATGTSSAAKTFIKRAMGVSPGDRPTCRDLLCDEWMKSESLEAANATKEFIDSLDDFLEFNDSSDSTNRRGPLVDASTFYPSSAQA